MDRFFYFHENSRKNPWKLPMDRAAFRPEDGFFALADGVARDIAHEEHDYPNDFHGAKAAEAFAQTALIKYKDFDYKNNGMQDLLHEMNKAIYDYNRSIGFDYEKYSENKEKYWMGECVGGVTVVQNGVLYYGVLEDCYINVLRGKELEDKVAMNHQIMKAYKYATNKAANNPSLKFEHIWCKELRNNPDAKDENGDTVGWGCFNGEESSKQFWQTGSVDLQKGDIILLVTDGALELFNEHPRSEETNKMIFYEGSSKGTTDQAKLSELVSGLIDSGIDKLEREKTIIRYIWE